MMYKFELAEKGSYLMGSHPALGRIDVFVYDGPDLDAAKATGFEFAASMAAFLESYGITFAGDLKAPEEITLSVTPVELEFDGEGGSSSLTVTASRDFKAAVSSGSNFCTAAVNAQTVTVNVAKNTSNDPRTAVVALSAGSQVISIPVRQEAAETHLTLSKTTVSLAAAGASDEITITTDAPSWEAAVTDPSATWCQLTQSDDKLTVRATAQTSTVARSATVRVTSGNATADVTVTQSGQEVTLSVNPNTVAITAAGSSSDVAVITNAATWDAVVTGSAPWCSVAKGSGKITITGQPNTTTSTRTAAVRLSAGAKTANVTVTQTAAAVTLSVSPQTVPVVAAGGSATLTVATNAPSWVSSIVETEATWLAASDSGSSVNLTVQENTDTASRIATVRVTAQGKTADSVVTQAGAVAP